MGITPARVAIVGGGISGLSTAYRLKKNGSDVTLFEAAPHVGGKIGTIYCDGFELDLGPVTISGTPGLRQIISGLGLEVIEASDASKVRYIYSKGKLHRVGANPLKSSVLSVAGKLSMLKAPFTSKVKEGETVAKYAQRRFGDEAYRRLFNPMMNGIYAGNSELIGAQSVFKKQGPRKIISLRGGFKSLTHALSTKLGSSIKTNATIGDLRDFDKIHFTTPAFVTANLIRHLDHKLADMLAGIRYSDVSQVYCEVIPGEQKFDGFGFLVPSEERMSLLGAICVSNIFPEKAPDGKTLFVLFCGGDRPYSFTPTVEGAVNEFNKILEPALTKVLHVQEWKQAIPQFYVGHQKILDQIGQFEKENPQIRISGNYITGVAVGDCI